MAAPLATATATVPGGSAAVAFVIAPRAGRVAAADGLDRLAADPQVHRCTLPVPADAAPAVDNESYLGHVVAVDPNGGGARARAEQLVASIGLGYGDGATAAPLAVSTA